MRNPLRLPRRLLALALGSLAMLAAGAVGAAPAGLGVGDAFPEVVLPSLADGAPTSVAAFRGRKLILHVWASW